MQPRRKLSIKTPLRARRVNRRRYSQPIPITTVLPGQTKYYVYLLIDSLTGEPFYVGKGTGHRLTQHESLAGTGGSFAYGMVKRIRAIWKAGGQVFKCAVHWTDDEMEAYRREAELIREYGLPSLANQNPGWVCRALGQQKAKAKSILATEVASWGVGDANEKLTDFGYSSSPSPDGNGTYSDWCLREGARIGSLPGRCAKVMQRGKGMAIFINAVCKTSTPAKAVG